jgi:hypothetical protein
MRKQTGCIYVNGDNWCLRWREGEGDARKLRFKILTPVTSEHRRSRDKKTHKLRIPDEVQAMANAVLGIVNTSPAAPYMVTITQSGTRHLFLDPGQSTW